jgi:hypothetical protein
MKASVLALTLGLVAGVAAPSEAAAAEVKAGLPVLVTSCGQSPGPVKVKLFMKRLKLDHVYDLGATAELVKSARQADKPFGSVIIVTGASLKGMGAAGVSIAEEIERVEALIAEARSQSLTIIAAHIEGMARRSQGAAAGDNSDEMSIDAVCPKADMLMVRKDGNADGRFSTISEQNEIPMVEFEKNMELGDVLKALFEN